MSKIGSCQVEPPVTKNLKNILMNNLKDREDKARLKSMGNKTIQTLTGEIEIRIKTKKNGRLEII
jgi:hypothetical protein